MSTCTPVIEITNLQARRLALGAQGFGRTLDAVSPRRLRSGLDRLGVLQIDSVNALVRSHYLPLYARFGPYSRSDLDRLAWGPPRHRHTFEYWGHEASLLPLDLHPLLRWRMARARQGRGIYRMLARFGEERQDVIGQVLETVRARGAVAAGEITVRTERAGSWWDWSEEKLALEWLFAAGEVAVADRRGFERRYDLTERVIPTPILNMETPSESEARRALMVISAKALGVATARDLQDYFRLEPGDARACLAELVEEGTLVPVKVRGWEKPAYCLGEPAMRRRVQASALLSPFDSLIWHRPRAERLFGFHYRLEFYTPVHKRQYGYYVMPFLHNERLLGRVDVRADRANGVLSICALHEERAGFDAVALEALHGELCRLAHWLGLDGLNLACPSGLAGRLRRLVSGG
ncbi:winged helix-turn-helix domain-containing protein [Pseudomonas sp. Marseille-QA0892]